MYLILSGQTWLIILVHLQLFPLLKYMINISLHVFFISYPLSALVHISSLEPIGSRADIMT